MQMVKGSEQDHSQEWMVKVQKKRKRAVERKKKRLDTASIVRDG
jgi:hypothetical protein